MLIGIFLDTNDIGDVRRGINQLQEWEAALMASDTPDARLLEVLRMPSARLARLAYEYFGTSQFDLHQLAERSGQNVRVLHGMTGSLGKACDSRGVEVFDRHGGQPLSMSVRQEVAELFADEAGAGPDGDQS